MRKRAIPIVIISVILVTLLFALSASAYIEVQLYEDRCYADGSFTFTAVNSKKDHLFTDRINVLVQNAYLRNLTFEPKGNWTRPLIYTNISEGKTYSSTFIGAENQIKVPGEYHAFVDFQGCREGKCRKAVYLQNCLAHNSDCAKFKPQVYSCFVDQEQRMAFIRFGGEQNKFFQSVDVGRDLLFYFQSNIRNLDGVKSVEGASYSNIGDIREMRFPLLKDENIDEVAIVHRRCDSPFQRMKIVECTTIAQEDTQKQEEVPSKEVELEPVKEQSKEEKVAEIIEKQAEVNKVKEQKKTKDELEEMKKELEQARIELALLKEQEQEEQAIAEAKARVAEKVKQQPESSGLVEVTGSVVGTDNAPGIPSHFYVLVAIVFAGMVLLVVSNQSKKKKARKKKKEEEAKARRFKKGPRSFGFGD